RAPGGARPRAGTRTPWHTARGTSAPGRPSPGGEAGTRARARFPAPAAEGASPPGTSAGATSCGSCIPARGAWRREAPSGSAAARTAPGPESPRSPPLLAELLEERLEDAVLAAPPLAKLVDGRERAELALIDDPDPVRQRLGDVQQLRRVDHGAAALRRVAHERLERDEAVRVHARGEGLVEQQEFRIDGQHGRESRLVGLPARQ